MIPTMAMRLRPAPLAVADSREPIDGGTPPNDLLRRPVFLGFLVLVFLGWVIEGLVQPLIPLAVLDRGGTAAIVGLVSAAYALPSVLLRPFIGRAIDRGGHDAIQRMGALTITASALLLTAPPLIATVMGRLGQGLGWSMYSTANNVLLARLSPPHRRGEASGVYNTTRALGLLVGPPVGLWLYLVAGSAAFVAVAVVGAGAFVGASLLRVPEQRAEPRAVDNGPRRGGIRGVLMGIFEPAAIPSMLMIATFMASQTIFIVFAPVYALSIGASIPELGLFYPAFGATLVIAPLVLGRVSDRLGRRRAVSVGCLVAIAGLGAAALPGGMVTFTAGAVVLAVAIAMVTPAIAAATMDQAPAGRLGSAVATYSVGYQLAAGLGGALWGLLITSFGFPWPFLVAIGLQAGTILLAWRFLHPLPSKV
jgi:MFS family permease